MTIIHIHSFSGVMFSRQNMTSELDPRAERVTGRSESQERRDRCHVLGEKGLRVTVRTRRGGIDATY